MNAKQQTLNGLAVQYYEGGQSEQRTLVLVHGGMGDAALYWSAVFDNLAESYHVIAPDLPGYGGSAPLPEPRLSALLDWLHTLLSATSAAEQVIIGSAFGALVARLYAAGYPDQVRGLVLVNGGSLPNVPPLMRSIAQLPGVGGLPFYLLARSTTGQVGRMIHAPELLTPEFRAEIQAHTGHFARLMRLFALDPLPATRTPDIPTLLLWGEQDGASGVDEARRIQKVFRDATLVPVAACGQMPARETPDVFVSQMGLFLRNLDRPSKRGNLPGVGRLN